MTFDIRINSAQVDAILNGAVSKLTHPAPLMQTVATELATITALNFLAQGRPRWEALKNPSPRRAGGMILQASGRLRDSYVPFHTATSAGVGSNVVYAAIQHFGGKTKPHVILPKNGKVLAFNGRFAKKVNHPGSKIPARPAMPVDRNGQLQPEATIEIQSAIQDYLRSAFGR